VNGITLILDLKPFFCRPCHICFRRLVRLCYSWGRYEEEWL